MLLFVSDEAYSPPDTKKVPLTHYFHLYDLEAEDFFDMFKLLLQVYRFCFISYYKQQLLSLLHQITPISLLYNSIYLFHPTAQTP